MTNKTKTLPAPDPERIAAIKARLANATEGEWRWIEGAFNSEGQINAGKDEVVCDFGTSHTYDSSPGMEPCEADIALIVTAKADLEYLLQFIQTHKQTFTTIADERENTK